MYSLEVNSKTVPIDKLTKYYNIKTVEGYCSNCKNYKKVWSCPPHDFNALDYLNRYNFVQVISVKVIFNKNKLGKDYKTEMLNAFQEARRKFGDYLIGLENNSEALISGNCYQCNICKRETDEKCILEGKKRYSLESLGLMVGEVTSNILNQELQFKKDEIPNYYLSVGALLLHENAPIENLFL